MVNWPLLALRPFRSWRYLRGSSEPSDPAAIWMLLFDRFNDSFLPGVAVPLVVGGVLVSASSLCLRCLASREITSSSSSSSSLRRRSSGTRAVSYPPEYGTSGCVAASASPPAFAASVSSEAK